jgi:hypothetical protein
MSWESVEREERDREALAATEFPTPTMVAGRVDIADAVLSVFGDIVRRRQLVGFLFPDAAAAPSTGYAESWVELGALAFWRRLDDDNKRRAIAWALAVK